MGAGKTSFGKALAQHLQLPFTDLDALIEERSKHTISSLIQNKGELYFRQLEREVLLSALDQNAFVLSTGGGTPVYYNNMEEITTRSRCFYLRATPPQLAARLADTQHKRPMLEHLSNTELSEFVAKHLFERSGYYQQAQHILNAAQPIEHNINLVENTIYGSK